MRRLLLAIVLILMPAQAMALEPGSYSALIKINADGTMEITVQTTVQVGIWTLEIIKVGTGTPVPAVGSHTYQDGSIVTLTSSSGGSPVWSGDTGCAGGSPHSITMNGNKRCTVTFTP